MYDPNEPVAERIRRRFGDAPTPAVDLTLDAPLAAEAVARAGARLGLLPAALGPTRIGALCAALERGGALGVATGPVDGARLWIEAALDAGAAGVLLRDAVGAQDVVAAAEAVFFPPDGKRSPPGDRGGPADEDASWNADAVLIVDVSRPDADPAACADAFGASALAFDPERFAALAGRPGAADVAAALERVVANPAGAPVLSAPFGDLTAADLAARGVSLIRVGSDASLLFKAARAAAKMTKI